MKTTDSHIYFNAKRDELDPFLRSAQIELTYRCNLKCPHCYCPTYKDDAGELTTAEIFTLLDALKERGYLWLTLTGGEPLLRKDFSQIYLYAKSLGFLVGIFTNGQLLTEGVVGLFKESPPYSIEVTLNAISEGTYRAVTGSGASLRRVMDNIASLAAAGLPVIIKTNLLKSNADEAVRIKRWADGVLARSASGYRFTYDPHVYPRLDGDAGPVGLRLSCEEIERVIGQDEEMLLEHREEICKELPDPIPETCRLYHCDTSARQLFITPSGRMKFCHFSEKLSVDVKGGFPKTDISTLFSKLSEETFKPASRCAGCELRRLCQWCPAKALLETGSEEAAVPYYCETARYLRDRTAEARREAARL